MKIKWTKADAKRAKKMGFEVHGFGIAIMKSGDRFKTDQEAAKWVVSATVGDEYWENPDFLAESDWNTCRKAILICCGA